MNVLLSDEFNMAVELVNKLFLPTETKNIYTGNRKIFVIALSRGN